MGEWDLGGYVDRHGTWVVGFVIFFESMGLPLPGESLLIAAAIYAATAGGLEIEWVVLAAAIGAIMGDNVGYMIGRRVGAPVLRRYGPRIGLTWPRQRLGQYLFFKHGAKVVFFGRFTAFLRTFAAVLAGANNMPWRSFLFWNGLGGVVWTASYGFGAYALGDQVHKLLGPAGLAIGAVVIAIVVWVGLFVRRHETRLINEAELELSRHEAAGQASPALTPSSRPTSQGERGIDRVIGG